MSYAIDVNVLVYATTTTSQFHARAAAFVDRCRAQPELLCLPWPTLMGYLRLVTNPTVVSPPLSFEQAAGNVQALLELPQVRVVSELDGFWEVFRDVTRGLAVRGNAIPDAHVAALLHQHGVKRLYTNDSDFRRFAFLSVENPLA
jgi:toxin-antitoxin system PIN domain toxin